MKCLRDERPLPFFILSFLLVFSVVNAQNVTDICNICTEETFAECIPKSWYEKISPPDLIAKGLNWFLSSAGIRFLPEITLQLIGLAIIIGLFWLFVEKVRMVVYIIVLGLVMAIVVTAILGYVGII